MQLQTPCYLTTYKTPSALQENTDYFNMFAAQPAHLNQQPYRQTVKTNNITVESIEGVTDRLKHFINTTLLTLENVVLQCTDMHDLYYTFQIPKATGGFRTIHAPNPDWAEALTTTKENIEKLRILEHDAAYAYVKQRSTKDALEKHQQNQSNWFLKLDIKDFFPNCSPEFIYTQLLQVYPFSAMEFVEESYHTAFKRILNFLALDNGLPQGTQTSPILTNLIMIPYDYEISKTLMHYNSSHLVYTRYADDILISSKAKFNKSEIENLISKIVQPFQIKSEKTRFGSKNGRNWNLGLMLNKDNNITVGYRKKKVLNAMLNNFLKAPHSFTNEEIYHLQGELSYLNHIEGDYFKYIVQKYENKYNVSYSQLLKQLL